MTKARPCAWLVFESEMQEGLSDHLARRDVLRTYPRSAQDAPSVGVFSLRSPDRPNPIGLHPVEVLDISGHRIRVSNLEAVDGTPIVDVKPVIGPIESR